MKQTRRKFSPEFKAKVALESLKEHLTIEEISKKYDIHPSQVNTWKKEFQEGAVSVFEKGPTKAVEDRDELVRHLYAQIGEMKVESDFLKKKLRQ